MYTCFNSQHRCGAAVRPAVLIVALAAIVTGAIVIRSTSPAQQIEKKQAALLEGIAKRSRSKVEKLIATDYRDRWQFDKQDAVTAFLDLGSQFMVLAVQSIDPKTELADDGKNAIVTARLQIAGSGSPVAQMIITRSNKLNEPFVFHWQKQSWWPGSWRLVEIDNPDLPDDLDGYTPGDIRKAMSF